MSVQCLTPYLGATLDLAVDILRNPTFPETEFRRIHGQTLAALRAERDSAEARAYRGRCSRRFTRKVIPTDFRSMAPRNRSRDARATTSNDSTDRITVPAAPRGLWRETSIPTRSPRNWMTVLVIGPVPPLFRPSIPLPTRADHPRILVLDRPGAPQAAVRVGHVGLHRLEDDYTDTLVLNHILGGQFTSRLNAKLREEKGFTYGVRSHFDVRRAAGPFYVAAALQLDTVAEALDDLRNEVLGLLGDRPPTPAELDDARRSLIEGQARHFETPSALVSRYASLFLYGLPLDHHAHFAERLEAVTIDSLVTAANRRIFPNSFIAVVVADASRVVKPLGKLGWGELTVVGE